MPSQQPYASTTITTATEPSEWVYLAPLNEPTVLEAESSRAPNITSIAPIKDLFSSTAAVESPDPQTDPEFYGDDDVDDDRIPAEEAFLKFAGRTFPSSGPATDYSGSIYIPSPSTSSTQPYPIKHHLPGCETRAERLARLIVEADLLAAETAAPSPAPASDADDEQQPPLAAAALDQLSELRGHLRKLRDGGFDPGSSSAALSIPITDPSSCAGPPASSNPDALLLRVVSPNISALSALEQRVTAVERSVGVCDLTHDTPEESVADVLADVRAQLAFVRDAQFSERLLTDARTVASMLQQLVTGDKGEQVVNLAKRVEHVEKWRHVVDVVPVVVERLRSVKTVQQEAAHFSSAVDSVCRLVAEVEGRDKENGQLLEDMRKSLEVNLKSVQQNLDMLSKRLDEAERGSEESGASDT